jgi:hypothetical protein
MQTGFHLVRCLEVRGSMVGLMSSNPDLIVNDFSPLIIRLVGDKARLDGTRDGSTLAVQVANSLPLVGTRRMPQRFLSDIRNVDD